MSLLALGVALLAGPAAAQLALPGIGVPSLDLPGAPLGRTLEGVSDTLEQATDRLLRSRVDRIDRLLRRHGERIELDARGEPARRGELLVLDPDPQVLGAVRAAGFDITGVDEMGSLGFSIVRLSLPRGVSLAEGEALLKRLAPAAQVTADNLHFQNGGSLLPLMQMSSTAVTPSIATPVGIIDGAPGRGQAVAAMRGFAKGAPVASDHGSAIASLLAGVGAQNLRVADVYGTDPAGGNALALVRALDWLAGGGARVISISLSGPPNPAVGKAIAAVQRDGAVVIAAVGNDGPAAPPAYPASYAGVVAVTGVDGRDRALLEAGRAQHLDYAAPGADIRARNKAGKWREVRGTSYAVPLVAARAAAALDRGGSWRVALDREAQDLGPRGPDDRYGRGLLCGACARRR